MAKEDTRSLYEKMRDALIEVQNYERGFEKAKEELEVNNAAVMAAGRKSPEAAQTLQSVDNSRHKANFLEAGLSDSTKGFEKDYLKNKGNLESIIGSKDVKPVLKSAVFAYEPAKTSSGKYAESAKLHKQLLPMLSRYNSFRGKQLSKDEEDQVFGEMSRDIIADYAKNEKDPLYLRAFVELAGGIVEKDKEGKMKVVKDKEGNIAIVANSAANKQFAGLRYESLIEEKKKKFFELVGEDLPGYITSTLPDKYDKAKGFYANVINMVEAKKEEGRKKK